MFENFLYQSTRLFRDAACLFSFHSPENKRLSSTPLETKENFTFAEEITEFSECANCHCKIEKDEIVIPLSKVGSPFVLPGSRKISQPRKCVVG